MMRHQLIQSYQKSERFFWSAISSAKTQIPGLDLYATGVCNNYLNVAIQKNPLTNDTFQKILDRIQDFYQAHHLPWMWGIRDDLLPTDLNIENSLELLDESTAMYYEINIPLTFKPTNELIIIENNTNLTDWGICIGKAYESSLEITNQYLEVHKKRTCDRTNFHHFVGYSHTMPVSSLTLSIHKKRARIDDVGTIPEHQNKGYATQMVIHALQKAKDLGAPYCFLESSKAGTKVYERIGFKKIFSNMYFQIGKCVL